MEKVWEIKDEKKIVLDSASGFLALERIEADSPSSREILVSAYAEVQYLLIADNVRNPDILRRLFRLEEGARLSVRYLFLGEGCQAWHLEHEIGPRARIESRSLAIGREANDFSVRADYDFRGESSFGRVTADAMISGGSRLRFDANINVLPLAQKSDTRVDLHLRLDGVQARGEMTPSLNIAANDVKAGHSASTFQLSPEDLFYLRSRGLSKKEISRLFVWSMASTFVREIKNENVREEVLEIIKGKL